MKLQVIVFECAIAVVFGIFVVLYLADTALMPSGMIDTTEEQPFIIIPPKEAPDKIFAVNSSGELTFYADGQVIGELVRLEDGTFTFAGKVDASAQRFFEAWTRLFDGQLDAICDARKEDTP